MPIPNTLCILSTIKKLSSHDIFAKKYSISLVFIIFVFSPLIMIEKRTNTKCGEKKMKTSNESSTKENRNDCSVTGVVTKRNIKNLSQLIGYCTGVSAASGYDVAVGRLYTKNIITEVKKAKAVSFELYGLEKGSIAGFLQNPETKEWWFLSKGESLKTTEAKNSALEVKITSVGGISIVTKEELENNRYLVSALLHSATNKEYNKNGLLRRRAAELWSSLCKGETSYVESVLTSYRGVPGGYWKDG